MRYIVHTDADRARSSGYRDAESMGDAAAQACRGWRSDGVWDGKPRAVQINGKGASAFTYWAGRRVATFTVEYPATDE